MKTPLKMGLLAFFALCASALSAQNWAPAFEDDEIEISVSTITCEQTPYLVFRIVNNTIDEMVTKFSVKYNRGGVNVDAVKEGYVVPANSSVEGDCMMIANYMEMLYVPLPRTHAVDVSAVDIQPL